jgi:hypothetical protein
MNLEELAFWLEKHPEYTLTIEGRSENEFYVRTCAAGKDVQHKLCYEGRLLNRPEFNEYLVSNLEDMWHRVEYYRVLDDMRVSL